MLSSPPRALAAATRSVAAFSTSPPRLRPGAADLVVRAPSSVRPSEQRSRTSPGLHACVLHVHGQVGLAPQGAGDHVAQGMAAGLVGRDHAALDLLVHPGVVGRELGDLPLAQEVDAAVPHVAEVGHVAVDEDGGHRRGHPLVLALLLGRLEHLAVRVADRGLQPVAVVGDVLVEAEGPGDLLVAAGQAHELVDGVDRDLGGDLARGVAAHAVGDHEQVLLGVHEEAVLVALALPPDVGDGLVGDLHGERCHGLFETNLTCDPRRESRR